MLNGAKNSLFEARLGNIEKWRERLEARFDGVDHRLDDVADKVKPIQQLEKLTSEDVFGRVLRHEQEVFRAWASFSAVGETSPTAWVSCWRGSP